MVVASLKFFSPLSLREPEVINYSSPDLYPVSTIVYILRKYENQRLPVLLVGGLQGYFQA